MVRGGGDNNEYAPRERSRLQEIAAPLPALVQRRASST